VSLPCFAPAGAALPLSGVTPAGLAGLAARLPPAQAAFLRATGFAAKDGEIALLPGPDGLAGAVLGLGAAGASPWPWGAAPFGLPAGTTWRIAAAPDPGAAALGFALGAYRFTRYKAPPRAAARLMPQAGATRTLIQAQAIWRARDLINTPAADLGPAELSETVRDLARSQGAEFEEISGAPLDKGFPAVAAVGGGSPRAPRVAILRWTGDASGPLVALCGKGVCFDTGGLDLKPSAAMLRMKKDMGGAAVMIALAESLIRSRAPIRLLLLVGAVENAVSGHAMRPMDVLRTRAGLTVEVGNTDAEGRLVLADLLAYAAEQAPDLLLDAATLTGAARVALGPDLPALFANDDRLADALLEGGRAVSDPLWRLPLHDGYAGWLDSQVADLNNVSAKPMAGAVIGALFLRRFVPAGIPWAHLDVYCWNDQTRPGRPEGGEAQGMRALQAGLENWLAGAVGTA
jgi:leucyl aminopeptidase